MRFTPFILQMKHFTNNNVLLNYIFFRVVCAGIIFVMFFFVRDMFDVSRKQKLHN